MDNPNSHEHTERMRRFNRRWWALFAGVVGSGFVVASNDEPNSWLAWLIAAGAAYMIWSRREFHRRMARILRGGK